jgi:hypothetical protein
VFVPVTTGATVFTGKPATTIVDADQRDVEPVAFVAVTFTDTNLPACDRVRGNVEFVAPSMTAHPAGRVWAIAVLTVQEYQAYA